MTKRATVVDLEIASDVKEFELKTCEISKDPKINDISYVGTDERCAVLDLDSRDSLIELLHILDAIDKRTVSTCLPAKKKKMLITHKSKKENV